MAFLSLLVLGFVFCAPLSIIWKARAYSNSSLNNIPGPIAASWLKGAARLILDMSDYLS